MGNLCWKNYRYCSNPKEAYCSHSSYFFWLLYPMEKFLIRFIALQRYKQYTLKFAEFKLKTYLFICFLNCPTDTNPHHTCVYKEQNTFIIAIQSLPFLLFFFSVSLNLFFFFTCYNILLYGELQRGVWCLQSKCKEREKVTFFSA